MQKKRKKGKNLEGLKILSWPLFLTETAFNGSLNIAWCNMSYLSRYNEFVYFWEDEHMVLYPNVKHNLHARRMRLAWKRRTWRKAWSEKVAVSENFLNLPVAKNQSSFYSWSLLSCIFRCYISMQRNCIMEWKNFSATICVRRYFHIFTWLS